MSFNYKNPISPISVLGNESVSRTDVFGTDFSVLGTGGYMEVYSLNDLIFSVPTGTLGLVEYSGNTIPIQLNIGSGAVFSPNVLTLNSDNISSGRRRIGMLVHVIEENQVYQFQVPNFTTLWNSATGSTGPGGSTVVFSNFGTTIKNNTASGQNLITAWTGSTIEDVSGGTRTNSNWIKYYGTDLAVTGGSFSNVTNVLTLTNITGGTIPITGFTSFDRAISAFTYDNANTFTIDDNSGITYNATIDIVTGFTVNGDLNVTGNTNVNDLSATTISATTYQNLPVSFDRYVTGFTYSPNTFTIADNSGSTFDATIDIVTGFTVNGNLLVTGDTNVNNLSATTISATTYQNLPIDPDTYVTGFTYSPNTFTIADNSGSTFDATIDIVTGLTVNGNLLVTGNTNVNNLSATTISATTYQNLPADFNTFVTGFTYSPNTFTIADNSGSTFDATIDIVTGFTVNGNLSVTGNTNVNDLSATTISATTYQNLPVSFDRYVTGFTYSPNTFTIADNSGVTYNATINTVTGLTVNGTLSATTISATTYQNLPVSFDRYVTGFTYSPNTFTISDNSGSTFDATINVMTGLTVNGNFNVSGDTTLDGPVTINITSSSIPSGTTTSILSITGSSIDFDFDLLEVDGDLSVSGNTILSGVTASTLNVTGDTILNGLSATTISATTYQNLPIDPDTYVTGFTYSPNTFTIADNSGSTFDATIDIVTGLTVNGNLSVTGTSQLDGGISSLSFTGATDRIVQSNSGGTLSAVTEIIQTYISSLSIVASQLSNTSNWDINGIYIGPVITNTFQGQRYYDSDYFFEAVDDNIWIRLIRG
jgi:hypothetical protein